MEPGVDTKRRAAMLGALAVPLLWRAGAFAQQARVLRIGYLAQLPQKNPNFEAFEKRMNELGWYRGKNFELEYFASSIASKTFDVAAEEMVKTGVDLIVTNNSPSTRAAMKATRAIPIVFGAAANPDRAGFIASYAQPGGNVTGLALDLDRLNSKRLEYLREMFPRAKRVGLLYQPGSLVEIEKELERKDREAAAKLGLEVEHIPVRDAAGIDAALAKAAASRVEAIRVSSATVFVTHMQEVAAAALKHRLPAMGADARMADAGMLATYGENLPLRFRRVAELVDKVLKGAKPASIPVEYPDNLELVVNLKSAKALGVEVPEGVLRQAKRVIE